MSDESFRPRKPISPAEVANQIADDEGTEALNEGAAVRRAIAAEVGQEYHDPAGEETPVRVTGQPPEQFQQLLARRRAQQAGAPTTPAPAAAPRRPTNEMRIAGSSKLEELIAGAREIVQHHHEVILPSLGKFYDGTDGPQDGKLYVRPMSGEEEKVLATPRLVRRGQAVNMIFDRCIQGEYRSENLLTADRTYLLIFLRGLSYTKDYDVEVRCPNCGTKFAHVIDLDTLWVDKCPQDFNEQALQGTLPSTGYKYSYRLSRGFDEQKVQDYRERRMKGFDLAGQADDTILFRTCLLLEDIEGLDDKDELQLLMSRLPIADTAYLRNVVNNQPFGVDTNVTIPCPSCLEDFTVDLPLEANFFFPRLRKDKKDTTQV